MAAGHLVQEVAVVRDDQDRSVPILQVRFQPFDGFDIQVVGGLIQQQQVGVGKQQPGQQGAGALPAGKLGQGALVIGRQETQAGQRLADAQLVGVAAAALEGQLAGAVELQGVLGLVGVAHQGLQAGQLGLLLDQVAEGRQALVPQGVLGDKHGFLRQVAHAQAAGAVHLAAGRLFQPDQDAQQGGLAHPVGAHQGDPRPVGDAERDVAEDIIRAKGFAQVRSR